MDHKCTDIWRKRRLYKRGKYKTSDFENEKHLSEIGGKYEVNNSISDEATWNVQYEIPPVESDSTGNWENEDSLSEDYSSAREIDRQKKTRYDLFSFHVQAMMEMCWN